MALEQRSESSESLHHMEIELGLEEPPIGTGRVYTARGNHSETNSFLSTTKTRRSWWPLMARMLVGAVFTILVVALISCKSRTPEAVRSVHTVCSASSRPNQKVRNVVFMIPDGMGPNYINLTKAAMELMGLDKEVLALDGIEFGAVHTRSLDFDITDSAAAATAYATGERTFNGNLSVVKGSVLPTVLEGAEAAGMWTGLVTTARITHATPAGFSAHIHDRDLENEIAEQQLQQGIEVLMGGGRRHMVPRDRDGSVRTDYKDLEKLAEGMGYNLLHTAADVEAAKIPALGLFSDSHMAFEMDRVNRNLSQPSLAVMARRALQLLSASPSGFFLMVEGGRIDHAGHMNDPVAAVHEVLAYDEAVKEVIKFAEWDGSTLVVSVADHETGGLFQGDQAEEPDYEALLKVTSSAEAIAEDIHEAVLAAGEAESAQQAAVRQVLKEVGVQESGLRDKDLSMLMEKADQVGLEYLEGGLPLAVGDAVSHILDVNWTGAHHTGVDVGLYAFGHEGLGWKTAMDNSDLGKAVISALGVDPDLGYAFTHGDDSSGACNLA